METARQKLNVAYLNGALLAAALFGWFAQSWIVFGIALVLMLGCGFHDGAIRPTRGKR